MGSRIDKKELIKRVSSKVSTSDNAETIIDVALNEIYEALKQGESVSLRNFGTFYIDWRRSGTVFKFNPSQKWRRLFGWSSTFNGEL